MKFDRNEHQKVRYDGQLYVVILEEFPDYYKKDPNSPVVLHPIGNDWIVRITNPTVRNFLTVRKGSSQEVSAEVME
jgi:hypothetical protein